MNEKIDPNLLAKGPDENLLDVVAPGGIEASEARGQRALINSDVLPKELNGVSACTTEQAFAKLGITIMGEADDLFYKVNLPEGWKKVAEDHDMWSKVVDENGCERMSIFYKAAFYDRNAFFSVTPRFQFENGTYQEPKIFACWIQDRKIGDQLFKTEVPEKMRESEEASFNRGLYDWMGEQRKLLFTKLKKNFPNCDDPFDWN